MEFNRNNELVLVTGANGFTGRFVCLELQKRNINFKVIIRPGNSSKWMRDHLIDYSFGDINNIDDLLKCLNGCTSLVNVASIGFGAAPYLIKACELEEVRRVIFVSTTSIFTNLNAKSKKIRLEAAKICLKTKNPRYE